MSKVHPTSTGQAEIVKTLVRARKRPAVLKLDLVQLRSKLPSIFIFAFEGDDDKLAYYHWIRRIRVDIIYEPFNCQGRGNVIDLLDIVSRDKGDLKRFVYFFADRDFEDTVTETRENLFVTDAYSIENYLVSEDVLEELLKNELHCDGNPEIRRDVVAMFRKLYDKFLKITADANKILFICKRNGTPVSGGVTDRIESLANVKLDEVLESDNPIHKRWSCPIDIKADEYKHLATEFENLDPRTRYRGKFAFCFFMKWLHLVVIDRNSNPSKLFGPESRSKSANYSDISIGALASKSRLPEGLSEFINGVAAIA